MRGCSRARELVTLDSSSHPCTALPLCSATAADVSSALESVVVNDEICRGVEGMGGVARLTACLAPFVAAASSTHLTADAPASAAVAVVPTRVVRGGLAVLRTLANSDHVKARMCDEAPQPPAAAAAGGGAPDSSGGAGAPRVSTLTLVLAVLTGPLAQVSPGVAEQAAGIIGNLALRTPDGVRAAIGAGGGVAALVGAMRSHPGEAGVQRAACLSLRNLVNRSAERKQAAFDEGVEPLLQAAFVRHPPARDVAYAAMRDLGLEYAETTTGRAQAERAARAAAAGDISVA